MSKKPKSAANKKKSSSSLAPPSSSDRPKLVPTGPSGTSGRIKAVNRGGSERKLRDLKKTTRPFLKEKEKEKDPSKSNSKRSKGKKRKSKDRSQHNSDSELAEGSRYDSLPQSDDGNDDNEFKEKGGKNDGMSNNSDFIAFDFSSDEEEEPVEEASKGYASDDQSVLPGGKNDDIFFSNSKGLKRSRSLAGSDLDSDEEIARKKHDASSEFPWIRNHDHSDQKEVSDWLNLEIKDFCDYLSPSRAEIVARNAAVKRLRKIVHDLWPDAELSVFGSFATDLYLPGSDIDMVVLSPSGKYSNKVFLFQLANKFKALKVCKSMEVIAKARVPIIKMVDSETNIHIDISFEKEGGVQAAELINSWIRDIPSLRYLVMVIKQFLSARKMNNVHNGGMGGFSVICIVYSFLKLHPKVASGYIDPSENLGVLLIEFFELYGKHFNYDMVALRMKDGCGYFPKRTNPEMQGKNSFILAIEDPNDSSNNISRGTYNIRFLKKAFAGAYGLLAQRCYDLEDMSYKERIGQSILGAIVKLKGPVRDFIDSTGEIVNLAKSRFNSPAQDSDGSYMEIKGYSASQTPEIQSDPLTNAEKEKNRGVILLNDSDDEDKADTIGEVEFFNVESSDSDEEASTSAKNESTKSLKKNSTSKKELNTIADDSRTTLTSSSRKPSNVNKQEVREFWLKKAGMGI